jgi:hypothetical protein
MAAEVQAKRQIIELSAYSMYAPNGKTASRARLVWGILGDMVRLTVFTNIPDDANNNRGMINAALGHVEFTIFVAKFNAITNGPNGVSDKVISLVPVRGDDNKVTDVRELGTIHFGKSDDGMIWMAVKTEGRPDIRFIFEPSMYTQFFINGQGCTQQENSLLYAKGKIGSLKSTVDLIVSQQIQIKEPRQAGGQAGAYTAPTAPNQTGGFDQDVQF